MNKRIILLCKNHKCNNNDSGDCMLDQVSQSSVGSTLPDRLICEDFEEKDEEDKNKKKF